MSSLRPEIPEFVRSMLHRLSAAGHEAHIVGGAVRDAVLKRPIADWDIATSASQEEISSVFEHEKMFSLKHGTVTLVHGGRHFEVTTFRGDGPGLVRDLFFRDFTVNAMALSTDGGLLIDPWGGEADIEGKIIRAVGEPATRFREDPLRLLRGIRLAAQLRFRIEGETLKAMGQNAVLLSSVAPERIRDELMKILLCPGPSRAFNTMVRTGLLAQFIPELLEGYLKRQNRYHRYTIFRHVMEAVDRIRPDPLLRLAALLHDVAKPRTRVKKAGKWTFHGHEKESALLAREILHRLRFSGEVARRVTHLVRHHMIGYDSTWSDAAVRRLIRRVGPDGIDDLLELRRADLLAHGLGDRNLRLAGELETRLKAQMKRGVPSSDHDLALNGRDVMAVTGLGPGPRVGEILGELNRRVTDNPELNNRRDLTALVRRLSAPAIPARKW